MSLSPSVISTFEIICTVQFTALFALVLTDSFSSIKQRLRIPSNRVLGNNTDTIVR
jgi:hypothetical protein